MILREFINQASFSLPLTSCRRRMDILWFLPSISMFAEEIPTFPRWDQDPRTTVRSPGNHIDHIAIYIYSSLSIYLCQYKSPYGPYLVLNSKILTMSCRSGFGLKIGCPIPFSGYIITIFPKTKFHFQIGYSWLYF